MRLALAIKAILFHLFQLNEVNFDNLTLYEKEKCSSLLEKAGYSIESFFSQQIFQISEKSNLILVLLKNGVDINHFIEFIDWQVFEQIIALIFSELDYTYITNYRFKDEFNKFEIDVLVFKFPYLFVIDCKFHKQTSSSFLIDAAKKQNERVESLIESFPIISNDLIIKLGLPIQRPLQIIPLIISWKTQTTYFQNHIPIVSYDQILGFVREIDEYRDFFLRYIIELK